MSKSWEPRRRYGILLVNQVTLQAFYKWVVYFIGPINLLAKRFGARYVIIGADYLTRWVEAKSVKSCSSVTTA